MLYPLLSLRRTQFRCHVLIPSMHSVLDSLREERSGNAQGVYLFVDSSGLEHS